MSPNFHEERRNSGSIATNFGEIRGHFSQLKIIGLDQSFPGQHQVIDADMVT